MKHFVFEITSSPSNATDTLGVFAIANDVKSDIVLHQILFDTLEAHLLAKGKYDEVWLSQADNDWEMAKGFFDEEFSKYIKRVNISVVELGTNEFYSLRIHKLEV